MKHNEAREYAAKLVASGQVVVAVRGDDFAYGQRHEVWGVAQHGSPENLFTSKWAFPKEWTEILGG